MRKAVLVVFAAGLAVAPAVQAQSVNDAAAYLALIFTPVGALPPVLTAPMLDRPMTSFDLAVRYGHISFTGASANAFDGRLGIPVNRSVVIGVNAGYQGFSCDAPNTCDGHFIGGANVQGKLTTVPLGSYADAARITIGLDGEIGMGHRSGTTLAAITGGLPIALVSGPPTLRVAPFLTPGFGWGRVSGSGNSESGTRFLLGGGVMFQSLTTGFGATVGFQKAFIQNGNTMFGVGLIIGAK